MMVHGAVSLVIAGDRTLHTLNANYRVKEKPTDVLSFPGARPVPTTRCIRGREPDPAELCIIVISIETASRNARGLGRTLSQELDFLALHGFQHVHGYDHETYHRNMDRLEARLRRRLHSA